MATRKGGGRMERGGGKTIACIGLAAVARVLGVPAIPTVPTKVQALSFHEACGGAAAVAAATIAAAGHRALLASAIGDDAVGDRLARALAARGVDVSRLARVAGAATPTAATIRAADGGCLVATHRGALAGPPVAHADALGACDALVADGSWPVLAARAFARAAPRGVPRVLELAAGEEAAPGLVAQASHIVLLAPGADARAALAAAAEAGGAMRLALGAGFALAWAGHGEAGALPPQDAAPAAARPAPGVFPGALALALARGMPCVEALRAAAQAAAREAAAPSTAFATS
ncbi:MAG: PfkB family carbohydrate kinase [Alphaproteobacteria bacterium]